MAINRTSPKKGKVVDIPTAPSVGTVTPSITSASVPFTASTKGGPVTTYTAISSPGSFTGTGSTSPVTVSGLSASTAYTFAVRGNNATGSSEYGSSSASVTTNAGGIKATGGTIVESGGYVYHVFTSTANFVTTSTIENAEYLVVAGGGAVSRGPSGAGGLRSATGQTLNGTYAATVGGISAGPYAGNLTTPAPQGNPSSFNGLACTGGGGGGTGGNTNGNGGAGGSGGGAGNDDDTSFTGGSGNAGGYSPVEGYAGSNSNNVSYGAGGGSGGAATNGTSSVAGNAGDGTSAFSTWLAATGRGHNVSGTYYIASGGNTTTNVPKGGGGYSGQNSGTANTGSGGKGADEGQGASGIVIVRYV